MVEVMLNMGVKSIEDKFTKPVEANWFPKLLEELRGIAQVQSHLPEYERLAVMNNGTKHRR